MKEAIQKPRDRDKKLKTSITNLSNTYLINDVKVLNQVLRGINMDVKLNASEKNEKKIELLRVQIKLRKVVYKQELKYFFSKARKRIPLDQLVEKYKIIFEKNPLGQESCDFTILDLIGKQVRHHFLIGLAKNINGLKVWY